MKTFSNVVLCLFIFTSCIAAYSDEIPPSNLVNVVTTNYNMVSNATGPTLYTVPAGETFILTDFYVWSPIALQNYGCVLMQNPVSGTAAQEEKWRKVVDLRFEA